MKLSYLILSAVLLSAVNTYAQNTFPANGNVGIGTSTAAYPLDVHANVNGTTGIQFTNDNTGSSARTRIFIGNGTNVGFINMNSPSYPTDPNSLSFWGPSSGGPLMFGTSGGERLRIDPSGNLGIGTAAPQSKLEINNGSYTSDNQLIVSGAEATRYYGVMGISVPSGNTTLSFGTRSNNVNFLKTLNLVNGNVGIGIAIPQNKLDVNGRIHAQSVFIDMLGWSDYVFKKDYQLRPLSEVKDYIDQNQHLPEIPSEQEIINKGLDVSEMNKLLMKKVEELTLYLIEKDKELKQEKTKNESQQTQINKMNQRMEEMDKRLKVISQR
jgi:hypothetical protein